MQYSFAVGAQVNLPGVAFICCSVLTGLLLWGPGRAVAAWTNAPGESLIILRLDASQLRPERGDKSDKLELALYAVYGLVEGITLGLSARGERLFPQNGQNAKLTDLQPFARLRLAHGDNWVISTETALSLPISRAAPHLSGTAEKWAAEGQLLAGIGGPLYGMHGFAVLGAGWRNRFGDGENAIKLQATAGLWPTDSLMLIAQSFTILERGKPLPGVTPRQDVTKLQASIVYKLTEILSVEIGGRLERTLGGRGRSRSVFLGLWTRF